MAAIADAIELFLQILSKDSANKPACDRASVNAASASCYLLTAFTWLVVWTKFSSKHVSALLTAGALAQCLAFVLLTIKVRASKSVAGLSSSTIELYIIFFLCRLPATCWSRGYFPVDKSGQFVYQSLDIISLVLCLQLLYCIHNTHKYTYDKDVDTLPVMPLLPPCVVMAYFCHATLARSFMYDTLWTFSLYVDTIALVPQLWMLAKIGGRVEGMTSHFIAAMTASRALSLCFWHHVSESLVDRGTGSYFACYQVYAAHGLQLLLAADFMYYYLRGKATGRGVVLPAQPGTAVTI
jgi:hypothetical protein